MKGFATISVTMTSLLLSGCAGLSIRQLDPRTMAVKPHTPNGAVYFLPKPYLLVSRLPTKAEAVVSNPPVDTRDGGKGGGAGSGGNHGQEQFGTRAPGGDDKPAGGASTPAPTGSGGGSDYVAQTDDYVLKLIYLPDRSHPMSITANAGIGTAKLTPTFENGWMLTGFSSEADSKASEFLQQITGLVTGGAKLFAPGGPSLTSDTGAASEILKPGLYEFVYDDTSGRLLGLCPTNFFTDRGTIVPLPSQPCYPR